MQVFSRRLFGLLSVLIAAVAIAACGGGDDNSDSGDSGGGSAESAPAEVVPEVRRRSRTPRSRTTSTPR